ncbi:hypothetical protein F3Y22_tig00110270pilonHSYRG00145 [Hibiscus syriacus]|uniref:Uncharacterized protein n=1 Tax=Hibiscus syriacus TaxID=106335 RepID=A0A6A3B814_HIBSY|nr:hypothetical protein F3Y22_tig00110270pilonHSYRG00145 [Hibiscus syriacus]
MTRMISRKKGMNWFFHARYCQSPPKVQGRGELQDKFDTSDVFSTDISGSVEKASVDIGFNVVDSDRVRQHQSSDVKEVIAVDETSSRAVADKLVLNCSLLIVFQNNEGKASSRTNIEERMERSFVLCRFNSEVRPSYLNISLIVGIHLQLLQCSMRQEESDAICCNIICNFKLDRDTRAIMNDKVGSTVRESKWIRYLPPPAKACTKRKLFGGDGSTTATFKDSSSVVTAAMVRSVWLRCGGGGGGRSNWGGSGWNFVEFGGQNWDESSSSSPWTVNAMDFRGGVNSGIRVFGYSIFGYSKLSDRRFLGLCFDPDVTGTW